MAQVDAPWREGKGADSRSLSGEPQGCLGSRRLCGWKLSRAQRKSAELGSRVDAVLRDRFATPTPVPLAWLFTTLRGGQEVGGITFSERRRGKAFER